MRQDKIKREDATSTLHLLHVRKKYDIPTPPVTFPEMLPEVQNNMNHCRCIFPLCIFLLKVALNQIFC